MSSAITHLVVDDILETQGAVIENMLLTKPSSHLFHCTEHTSSQTPAMNTSNHSEDITADVYR